MGSDDHGHSQGMGHGQAQNPGGGLPRPGSSAGLSGLRGGGGGGMKRIASYSSFAGVAEFPLSDTPSRTLFVRGVEQSADDDELRMVFEVQLSPALFCRCFG